MDVREYAPITKALSMMDEASREKMIKKFEVAFMIAKNNMAMTKMKPICELEERHGVDLGQGYKNSQAGASFIEFIALEHGVDLGQGYKNNQACASFIEFIALDQQCSLVETVSCQFLQPTSRWYY